jgi:zinc protease
VPVWTLLLPLLSHPAAAAADIKVEPETFALDNGLQVMLLVDRSLPQVVVNTWYDVGSKDEPAGRSGFAHLFEHLMFMGTTRLPGSGFDDLMEQHGGWNNAWTSEDATDYYDVGPTELLDLLLWMEADRMDGLDGAMTRKKLDLQREVVRNERRQSSEDTPYGVVWLEMNAAMYPPDHPYGHTVIGSHEDLQAATVDDVVNFFRTWYVPNNAGLVVAGDFDPIATKATIQRLFSELPRAELPKRTAPTPVDLPVKPLAEYTDQVQLAKTTMVWHSPAAFQPGDAENDVAATILGSGLSSRLYQALVVEQGIAVEIDAGQYSQTFSSLFVVEATPAEGHTMAEVEAAVDRELQRLATEGPTAVEMERVINQLELAFLQQLEGIQDRAMAINRYRGLTGDPNFTARDLQRYRDVTPAGVAAAAARLTADRRHISRVTPAAPTGADQ